MDRREGRSCRTLWHRAHRSAAGSTRTNDAWTEADPCLCPNCGRESCEDHLPPDAAPPDGFPAEELDDGVIIVQQGRQIDAAGVPYLVDRLIPAYGMLGFLVAFAK